MTLPDKIKLLRKQKNLRQKQIAHLAKLKTCTYAAYEEGRATPRPAVLLRIARVLGYTMEQLVDEEIAV